MPNYSFALEIACNKYGEAKVRQMVARHGEAWLAGILTEHNRREAELRQEKSQRPVGVQRPPEVVIEPEAEAIKLWPVVALGAIQSGHGGAWKVWRIGKFLDGQREATGRIEIDALFSTLRSQGVSDRARQRWIRDAVKIGVITKGRSGGHTYYWLASLGKAAAAFGAEIGARPAVLKDVSALFKNGWRAEVWRCFIASRSGGNASPISQESLEKITGVPARTQSHYQAEREITCIKNFAPQNGSMPADDDIEAMKSLTGYAYFRDGDNRLNQRLPDIRTCEAVHAVAAKRGRTRNAKRELGRQSSVLLKQQASGGEQELQRLFYTSSEAAGKASGRGREAFWCKAIKSSLMVNEWRLEDGCSYA